MNAMLQEEVPGKWEMKELKPWHKQLCSMLAQGIPRDTISAVLDCTPEYVSMLAKQPLVLAYIREMCQFANLQLEAQFIKGVEVIGDILVNGNDKEKLQAVRLQAEMTHRIGSGTSVSPEVLDTNERLAKLAERLLVLHERHLQPVQTINGEFHEIQAS